MGLWCCFDSFFFLFFLCWVFLVVWDPLFVEVCRLLFAATSRHGAQAPGCGASVVEECGLSGGGFQAL